MVEEWDDECGCRLVNRIEWDSSYCEADEKGVAEVERWHGGEFVGEAVIGPD